MFFEEHEKKIYSPESKPDLKFDPLAVDRELVKATGGKLSELLKAWGPIPLGADGRPLTGDISEEGIANAKLVQAEAEEHLAKAARFTFKLGEFPHCTDAEALEILVDYLWWMEGKGDAARTPQTSPPSTVIKVTPI